MKVDNFTSLHDFVLWSDDRRPFHRTLHLVRFTYHGDPNTSRVGRYDTLRYLVLIFVTLHRCPKIVSKMNSSVRGDNTLS